MEQQEVYMRRALELAKEAAQHGEVPVGVRYCFGWEKLSVRDAISVRKSRARRPMLKWRRLRRQTQP